MKQDKAALVTSASLTREAIQSAVLSAVNEVSAMNGHNVNATEATTPFELPDFESITSVEVLVQISAKLKVKLRNNPFIPSTGTTVDRLETVINVIYQSFKEAA